MLIRIKNITIQSGGGPSDVGPSEKHGSQLSPRQMSILTRRSARTSVNRLSANYVHRTVTVEVSSDPIRPLMAVSAVAAISERASAVVNKPESVVLPIYYTKEGSRGDVLKDALIGRQRLSDVSVIVPITTKASALVTSLQDTLSDADDVGPTGPPTTGLYVCALLVNEDVTKNDVKEAIELVLDGSVLTPGGLSFSSLTTDGTLRALDSSKVVLDSVPTDSTGDGSTMSGLITGGASIPDVPWYNTQVFYDGLVAVASVVGGVLALTTGVGAPLGLGLLAIGVNRLIQSVTSSIYDERTEGSLAATFTLGRLVSDCMAFASVFVPALLPINGMAKVATVAGAMALNRLVIAEDASTLKAAFDPAVTLVDNVYQVWRVIPIILIALIAVAAGNHGHDWGLANRGGRIERGSRRLAERRERPGDDKEDPLHRFVIRRL